MLLWRAPVDSNYTYRQCIICCETNSTWAHSSSNCWVGGIQLLRHPTRATTKRNKSTGRPPHGRKGLYGSAPSPAAYPTEKRHVFRAPDSPPESPGLPTAPG